MSAVGGIIMDQIKIGNLLKTLRKEKGITQEQLAEALGVTNRSVSRWETGANLPDFDLLMELASYYNVGIEELLNGERKDEHMDKKDEAVLLKVSDYESTAFLNATRRMRFAYLVGAISLIAYIVMRSPGVDPGTPYTMLEGLTIGIPLGVLIGGFIYTTRYGARIRELKKRLLRRITHLAGSEGDV